MSPEFGSKPKEIVKVSGFRIEKLVGEQEIKNKLVQIADQIYQDYYLQGKDPTFICVLEGAESSYIWLTQELGRGNPLTDRKPVSTHGGHIGLSSYGKDKTPGKHEITKPLSIDIFGKDIIVVEDIVDSGRTIKTLEVILGEYEPKSIEFFALLDKKEGRKIEVNVKYKGIEIPKEFVVGFGLDYEEDDLRNIPWIGVLQTKE